MVNSQRDEQRRYMKETFVKKNFNPTSLATIQTVNTILVEYEKQGFRLSLRQLYYQLVARDYIPNSQRSYKNLGNLVSNARQAGLVDWEMIEDRGRETVLPSHWRNPAHIVRVAAEQFRIDKWIDQPYHVEVLVEKDALSGVLEPTCADLDVGLTANKGYSSSSTMYEIGKRLAAHRKEGKEILVLYLGDHDPSGIDMTRDVDDRLNMYSRLWGGVEIKRLALNYDQVELWKPPENPAKETDARYAAYAKQFGESSWELDAVEPVTLSQLVIDAVETVRDDDAWDDALEKEESMRAKLQEFCQTYEEE